MLIFFHSSTNISIHALHSASCMHFNQLFTGTALAICVAHLENFLYTLSLPLLAVSIGMVDILVRLCVRLERKLPIIVQLLSTVLLAK